MMSFLSPGDQCWAEFNPDTPHFFKIILDDADTQKLRIPEKFAKRYGSEISSLIKLKVPSGELWSVELTNCEDDTWLHNGWSEFAKQYSLSNGFFLVFRFEGNCNFHVIIFDRSDTEISYPYSRTYGSRAPNSGEFIGHASVQVLDDTPPSEQMRVGLPSPSCQPHKEISGTQCSMVPYGGEFIDHALEDNDDDISIEVLGDTPFEETRVGSSSPSSQPHKEIESTSHISIRHSPVISIGVYENPELEHNVYSAKRSGTRLHQGTLCGKERAKAFLESSSFKSENPFFVVVMQPSYISNNLTVPIKFCEKYLLKKSCEYLCASHKKARSVALAISSRPKFKAGWKESVKENNLEVGDVCVFELINQTKIIFNSVIFWRVKDAKTDPTPAEDGAQEEPCTLSFRKRPHQATLSSEERAKAFLEASSFKSENPFFVVVMQPSYVCSKLCLPVKFCGDYLSKNSCEAILSVSQRKAWSVVLSMSSTVPKLKAGWKAFVKENNLKVGDVCVFELINQTKVTFNVVIFYSVQDEKTGPTPARDGAENEPCTTSNTSQICCIPDVPPCNRSATEISYPHGGTHGSRVPSGEGFQDHAIEDNNDGILVEVLDDNPPSKKARVRSSSPSSHPHMTLSSTLNISISHSSIKSSGVRYDIPEPNRLNADLVKRSGKQLHQGTLSSQERAKAFLEASSFESDNTFFVSVMQPSYIDDKSLTIPIKFCGKYLPKHNCEAILCVSHRKARSVKFSISSRPKLRAGWKAFVKENNLEIGDVCIFELINQTKTKITFNVVIFRRYQDAKTGPTPEKDGNQEEPCVISKLTSTPTKTATSAPQRITVFKPGNPFFLITTPPSGIHYVSTPCSFIKEHIKKDSVNLTLENGGKLWPVKISIYPMNRIAYLGVGWGTFVRENSIKAGEVCVLELINKEDAVLRVHTTSNMEKDVAQEEPCTISSTSQNCCVNDVPPCNQTSTPTETAASAPKDSLHPNLQTPLS